ncbi:hypothetical protein MGYG_08413 [Nannizzia gypsea CBS 118893]|uniref:Uncharacterized protein n=1 Tax=Arthroderma gypseum (strain ATCC MYA-4604 / CBS 118893) TaxID=535722 RepID=E4V5M6_ARTGP|nr:hypothetical protein MGYG_08413 [Nannizzia gypsea CBS 118893]EFR05401.1 hypothetical protein MGYG_08413 [Nannizzia gypsea CBS 118893]
MCDKVGKLALTGTINTLLRTYHAQVTDTGMSYGDDISAVKTKGKRVIIASIDAYHGLRKLDDLRKVFDPMDFNLTRHQPLLTGLVRFPACSFGRAAPN